MHCLGVSPDLELGFGFGVPESGVGLDRASASGLLHRLDFCVWYLAIGGGHVTGCDSEASDWMKGIDTCRRQTHRRMCSSNVHN